MTISLRADSSRAVVVLDGVDRVAFNEDGSMELLTPTANPTGNKVMTVSQMPFSREYTSPPQTWVAGALITLPHGLGSTPALFQFYMQCVTADGGYSTGDIVKFSGDADNNSTVNGYGVQIYNPNTTNILGRLGNVGLCSSLMHKTTGAMFTPNNPNWRLIVRAWA